MFRRLFSGLALLALAGLVDAPAAHAAAIIDFTGGTASGGLISYHGDGGALTGTGIGIEVVKGIATPLNAGSNKTLGGPGTCPAPFTTCAVLTFTTGAFDAAASATAGGYVFGAGGTFSITGTMPVAGINTTTTLLSGTLSSVLVKLNGTAITFTGIDDPVNTALLGYFGISAGTSLALNGGINTQVAQSGLTGSGGTVITTVNQTQTFSMKTTTGTDLSNIATPEPISLSLVLLGGGLAEIRRRRKVRAARSAKVAL